MQNGPQDSGKLVFPPDLEEFSQACLFCGYDVVAKQPNTKGLMPRY